MENKRSIITFALIIIFLGSIGLIAGCGDTDTESETDNEMGVTPQEQQQRENTRQPDTTRTGEEQTFEASLNGSNQVPEQVETEASGNVTVTLRNDSVHIEGQFSDLSSEYLASHIHLGSEDENGDPIQPLNPELGDDKTSGTWNASYKLDEEHLSALTNDSLYVNVHSEEFSGGEIRGQLTSSSDMDVNM